MARRPPPRPRIEAEAPRRHAALLSWADAIPPEVFPLTRTLRSLRWTVIGPVALVAAAIALVLWFDAREGGAAKPAQPLGELGTPVRNAYVAPTPTATPEPGAPTPRPRPTLVAGVRGSAEERDAQRRADLLVLLDAANRLKARDGSYPGTNGNVQTVCAFKTIDVGCKLGEVLGRDPPVDPFGDPVKTGYWYSSDGNSVRVYAALEGEIPDSQRCQTEDRELAKKQNVICVRAP
jgi:hypothetical protein